MVADGDAYTIGRRLREVRAWRGLSLRVAAELAGLSAGHLSRIERGERPVDKRSTLEALATALRVAPAELTGQPYRPVDPLTAEAHTAITDVEIALSEPALGEGGGGVPRGRPWRQLEAELAELNTAWRPGADYAAQGRVLPGLIADLHAAMVYEPEHRREVLIALIDAYHAAEELTKTLGVPGLPQLAALHLQAVAEELAGPAWLGLAAWVRAIAVGTSSRDRMLSLAQRAADDLASTTHDDPATLEMYGAAHLNAALACAAMSRAEDAAGHLAEADDAARCVAADPEGFGFGHVYFGVHNVGIWRVSLAVELGEAGRVAEIARDVNPMAVPSKARQAMFYADLGRGLAAERATRDQAVVALRTAEEIAPTLIQSNVYVRETVADLVRRARRDAAGRELRGLAYRMGVPV